MNPRSNHARRRTRLKRKLRRAVRYRWTPLAAGILLAGLVGVAALSSCDRWQPVQPIEPLGPSGVPVVRVKLTPRPVDSATFATQGPWRLYVGSRCVRQDDRSLSSLTIRRAGNAWLVGADSYPGETLDLQAGDTALARVNETAYRGRLRLVPQPGNQFAVVNHLDMESYLAGVLAKELLAYWDEETYKALAIAARTFARYQAITAGANNFYDVTDDQASQVYGGYAAETPRSRSAVLATRGVMLVYGPPGKEGLFLAQYSACCGGTVNGAYVLRNVPDLPPLAGGQSCDDCARCTRYRWPAVRVARSDAYRALVMAYPAAATLGEVKDIRVVAIMPYGRAVWLDVIGNAGAAPLRIRADDLRLALLRARAPGASQVYSMNCQIRIVGDAVEFYDGRGFGHGVGLCQWGAQGKAARGWTYEQILDFYYPQAKLMKMY